MEDAEALVYRRTLELLNRDLTLAYENLTAVQNRCNELRQALCASSFIEKLAESDACFLESRHAHRLICLGEALAREEADNRALSMDGLVSAVGLLASAKEAGNEKVFREVAMAVAVKAARLAFEGTE